MTSCRSLSNAFCVEITKFGPERISRACRALQRLRPLQDSMLKPARSNPIKVGKIDHDGAVLDIKGHEMRQYASMSIGRSARDASNFPLARRGSLTPLKVSSAESALCGTCSLHTCLPHRRRQHNLRLQATLNEPRPPHAWSRSLGVITLRQCCGLSNCMRVYFGDRLNEACCPE